MHNVQLSDNLNLIFVLGFISGDSLGYPMPTPTMNSQSAGMFRACFHFGPAVSSENRAPTLPTSTVPSPRPCAAMQTFSAIRPASMRLSPWAKRKANVGALW